MRMTGEQYYLNEIAVKSKQVAELLAENGAQTAEIEALKKKIETLEEQAAPRKDG